MWDALKWSIHTALTHCSFEVNAIHTVGKLLLIQGLKICFKTENLQSTHLDCLYVFFMNVLNNLGIFFRLFVSNSIHDSAKPMLNIRIPLPHYSTLATPTKSARLTRPPFKMQ